MPTIVAMHSLSKAILAYISSPMIQLLEVRRERGGRDKGHGFWDTVNTAR